MNCSNCTVKINLNSIRQGGDVYCSVECANLAAGYETNTDNSYFEEESCLQEHFENYEE
jgi:hypothetical protein